MEFPVSKRIQAEILNCEPEDVDPVEFAQKVGLDAVGFWVFSPASTASGMTSTGEKRWAGGTLRSWADWEEWVKTWPDPVTEAHSEELRRFIARCRRTDLAVWAGTGLGIDQLTRSWDIERFSLLMMDDISSLRDMMDRYIEWSVVYFEELSQLDLDFLFTGHDLAHTQGTLFSPTFLREEVFPREREVAKRITLPWAYHCCGDFTSVAEDIIDHGCSAIHPFQPEAIDIVSFKKKYGDTVCVIGNISLDALMFRDPEVVEEEVRRRISRLAPGGGYIVSSAHSIYGDCKAANVLRMGEAIRTYGSHPVATD